jgi:hypothetical protein
VSVEFLQTVVQAMGETGNLRKAATRVDRVGLPGPRLYLSKRRHQCAAILIVRRGLAVAA